MKLMVPLVDRDIHWRSHRLAFTLIEMIVSLATIALLLSLILPAIQHSRESARRMACASSLRQLGIAVAQYAGTHNVLPPGSRAIARCWVSCDTWVTAI